MLSRFLEELSAGGSGLAERFFNPSETFSFYSDPDLESNERSLVGLDEHFAELQASGINVEVVAVDTYAYDPGVEGRKTGGLGAWLGLAGEAGPGTATAWVDCETGLFWRLSIGAWSTDEPPSVTPPAPCSQQASERLIAQFLDAVRTGGDGLAARYFDHGEAFDLYRGPGSPAEGITDPAALEPHLGVLRVARLDVSVREPTAYHYVYWASDTLVGVLRVGLRRRGESEVAVATAAVDCTTGRFLYLSIDDAAPPR